MEVHNGYECGNSLLSERMGKLSFSLRFCGWKIGVESLKTTKVK